MGGVIPRPLANRFLLVSSKSSLGEENPVPLEATPFGNDVINTNNPTNIKPTSNIILFSMTADLFMTCLTLSIS